MDAEPGTSTGGIYSPPKKRKSLGHLSSAEKQTVINIYKKTVTDQPDIKKGEMIKQISEVVGISKNTVYRTIHEYKKTGKTSDPKQITGRPSLLESFDETVKTAVRRIIHNMFRENELPTLDKVLTQIKSNNDLPNMSRSTLHRLMKSINFKYIKRSRKSVLTEKDEIIRWRCQYLRDISLYRSDNRPIFYLDETWLNEGHTVQKVWTDTNIHSRRQAFVEGLTTGLKDPSGKGRRLIILHIGSSNGFVETGLLLFEGKKTADYHDEMNAAVFEEWFSGILKVLPDNAVIVLDNASYHSRKSERTPSTSWRKADIQNWLRSKRIEYDNNMVRAELLHLVRIHKTKYNSYIIDDIAKRENKTVLRLPPYHCELNPIELIWAQIKNEVAAKNKTFKLAQVKQLLHDAINNITATTWQKCISHVIKEEIRMKSLDGIIDGVMEPFIIAVGEDSDTEESDSLELSE